ncbi:MAG: ATPase [Candidatus Harrisonbacteria bacterium CG10_big_fil_rev_8_21_14_0_10_44_23]|uniref:ATPase n=1 Tax=Candidatus Harrisonbacteria bacterium CG10_big_fil_rev_8_21_14_0_10_44_23 TaxID=1974585 RepID=A0A2H0UPU2_9BACT|nr:MAG: ATPase [Candidatus Harrisonbacteria bacterium CG10_big_fil_rev_8_21_14_0_10_44_23]
MNKELIVEKSVKVSAPVQKVWEALTNPEMVKQYLFGTQLVTDWQVGNDIVFQGSYEGKEYLDKGKIVQFEPEKLLQYTYLSSFSGLEDKEENYSLVTYEVSGEDGDITLKVSQKRFANEQAREHSESGWDMVLNGIKKLVESE